MTSKTLYTEPSRVTANGIEIVYDSFGDPAAPPMLLVMGLGAQLIAWDPDFCQALAAAGYWVIRFDNRDVGLSTHFEEAGVPDLPVLMQAVVTGAPIEAPYLLRDMAEDAVDLLDALQIEHAHLLGVSMGGMIVQEMAINHPGRVRTMTSIMSSTGNPALPPPTAEAIAVLMKPAPVGRAAHIESSVEGSRVLSGPGLPIEEERLRIRAGEDFDRGLSPTGTARQMAAILGSGSRKESLKSLSMPTLVIHGDADPLVPVEGGIDTAEAIPGAELLIIKGMGHYMPPIIWPQVIEKIVGHAV